MVLMIGTMNVTKQ